jgi:hypothetical protein
LFFFCNRECSESRFYAVLAILGETNKPLNYAAENSYCLELPFQLLLTIVLVFPLPNNQTTPSGTNRSFLTHIAASLASNVKKGGKSC